MPEVPQFADDHLLRVGSCEFHCSHPIGHVPAGRLPVEKPRALVEDYVEMCRELRPKRIVELGVYKGGSTALISELAHPEKLVAIELSEGPVPVLADYIEERGLAGVVRPYFGVDQSDRTRVAEIARTEFAGEPLDLVVDDASHLYDESRSSFETLFPLVRAGGLFILEDWRWQHQVADGAAAAMASSTPLSERALQAIARRMEEVAAGTAKRELPLSRLAIEFLLACASSSEAVAEVTIGPYWASARRGTGTLDAGTFRMARLFHDHFNLLGSAS